MFEETLGLPLGHVGEIDADVHTPRPAQRWVKALNVVGGEENKSIKR